MISILHEKKEKSRFFLVSSGTTITIFLSFHYFCNIINTTFYFNCKEYLKLQSFQKIRHLQKIYEIPGKGRNIELHRKLQKQKSHPNQLEKNLLKNSTPVSRIKECKNIINKLMEESCKN